MNSGLHLRRVGGGYLGGHRGIDLATEEVATVHGKVIIKAIAS